MSWLSQPRRASRLALAAAGIVAITGGAVFGAIRISSTVAQAAIELHAVDDAARAATVVRSHIAIAQGASNKQMTVSIGEAAESLQVLESSLPGFPSDGPGGVASDEVARFIDVAAEDIDAIGTSPIDEIELDDSFQTAMSSIDEVRNELVVRLADLNSNYRIVGILLGLVIAGLAPLIFFLWARIVTKRTMQVRELSMKLDHQGALTEARTEVLRTVVHEFRTPLTGIVGLAGILESAEIRASHEGAEMVSMIRVEAEDMTQLTDDVLVSEGLKVGKFEVGLAPVDVGDTIDQVLQTFERREIDIDGRWEPGFVLADERRLRQVIRNLVSNAVKYGGTEIAVIGRRRGENYRVSVVDNGPGVPEEIEDRLFIPYPHLGVGTASSQSVGLGLAIVKQLAQAMGGSVSYERRADKTIFKLILEAIPESQSGSAFRTVPLGVSP